MSGKIEKMREGNDGGLKEREKVSFWVVVALFL